MVIKTKQKDIYTELEDKITNEKTYESLTEKIEMIDDRLKTIEESIKELVPIRKIIFVENLSKEDAKEKIKNFIKQIDAKTQFYPDDISEKLHIEFQLVMQIVDELINEEIIEVYNGINN